MTGVDKTLRTAAALSLAACLALTSCGGDNKDDAKDGETGTPTPSLTVTLPAGATLTAPGSELSFGETATVHYSPSQSLGSTLKLTVKDATLGRLSDLKGFNLDTDYKRNANYYFVNVDVENLGDGDLGGRDVPLNGVNDKDTLLPPVVFQSAFEKCPSKRMPKPFTTGDKFSTCLVFLSPDKGPLTAVSYRPTETDEPILWTGEIQQPKPVRKPKKNG
jgi:hypothetical protein